MLFMIAAITVLTLAIYVFIYHLSPRWTLIDSFVFGIFLYQAGACFLAWDVGIDDASWIILASSTLCFLVSCIMGGSLRGSIARRIPALQEASGQPMIHLESQLATLSAFLLATVNAVIFFMVVYRFLDLLVEMKPGFLLEIRKQIASGERGFFAPGAIKQLRDIISPAVICFLFIFLHKGKSFSVAAFVLLFSVLSATLIGGQRLPVVILFVSLFLIYAKLNGKGQGKVFLTFGIAVALLMLLLNLMLGRAGEVSGLIDAFTSTIYGLLWRAFLVVPYENYSSIDFLLSAEFDHFDIWLQELSSILPGVKSSLSSELHANLGGSYQGNSVLGAGLSAYMNFGYLGVVLYPLFMMFMIALFEWTVVGLSSRLLYALRILLIFQIPLWYSPFLMLLNGGLVFVFFAGLALVTRFLNQMYRRLRLENKGNSH